MTEVIETITVEGDEITVSLVVWRRFHRPMPELVERIYDMNQDLAELGLYLPVGTSFDMPVTTPRPSVFLDEIKLW